MKYLVIFALISLAACNTEEEILLNNLIEALVKCQINTGVSIGHNDLLDTNSDTKDVKCMRFCILNNLGMADSKGKIIKNAAKNMLVSLSNRKINEKTAARVIDGCNNLKGSSDHCEAASDAAKCIKNALWGKGFVY